VDSRNPAQEISELTAEKTTKQVDMHIDCNLLNLKNMQVSILNEKEPDYTPVTI
jgi:hypothetical protein